jgi:GNAT superfamily N-acetyltransferase
MHLRRASAADAAAIAALHAASWRHAYGGAMSDEYLAGDIVADRNTVWSERLGNPSPNQYVVVAEASGQIAGFACAYGAEHPEWGSLLDNIHVAQSLHRKGIGALILRDVVLWCAAVAPECLLYLWVLQNNARAQAFYRRLGAVNAGQDVWVPPGGGAVARYRFAWERPQLLLAETR